MRQCICQICVCGRHRCEHSAKRKVPFAKDDAARALVTEHKERFRPFGFQPRQKPIKPQGADRWQGDAPPVKESITKKDFVAFPIKKRTLKRPKRHKDGPSDKMADSTTYKHDFTPKELCPSGKAAVPGPCTDGTMPGTLPGKMETVTTYNKAYTPKECQKREQATKKECTLTEFGKPFTGQTETGLSYKPHPIQKREGFSPVKGTLKTGGDFHGSTTHKTDFTPKYQVPVRPTKKIPKWKPDKEKFEDETTHKHDYKCPVSPEKVVSCAPKPEIAKSKEPFLGRSLYKEEFKPHGVTAERKLPSWHPLSRSSKRETAPFEGVSTYQKDFEAPPEDFPQYSPSRPQKGNLTLPSGPMEKTTTSMRDYQKKPLVPARSFKPDAKYEKPKDRFSGCTITRTDYTPKTIERAAIKTKLPDSLRVGDGPMEDMTTTMKDFQWLALECPAAYIKLFGKDALPQFEFDKAEKGHVFFKRLKKTKCHKTGLTKKVEAVK